MFMKRGIKFTSVLSSHFLSRVRNLRLRASTIGDKDNESAQLAPLDDNLQVTSLNQSSGIHLSPLFSRDKPHSVGYEYDIELVDPEAWRVSSGLAQAWKGKDGGLETRFAHVEEVDEPFIDNSPHIQDDPDFDEIEDMRIRGNLFYKLDRNSKEFEEYNFEFRGKKRNKIDKKESKEDPNPNPNQNPNPNPPKVVKNKCVTSQISALDKSFVEKKKLRTLTYNQLTGPYHEPFCLDIYISKGSVRACIVHRATSNVVAVAHSISKDMKFDLASTRDAKACVAVGSILAQRALADDIHDVIYTPRKGERLEGKLQIVLQAVIDNGVNVKVKIKQRHKRTARPITA